jgi:hypothetical protein
MLKVIHTELAFDKKKNFEERLKFIHFYAEWVRRVPNDVWSRQQAELIDSFVLNACNFKISREDYLKMVGM